MKFPPVYSVFLTGLAVFGASIQLVSAAVIAYEGFNYNSGQSLGGLNGGTGWNGPWVVPSTGGTIMVTKPGYTYPGANVQGASITVTPTSANIGAVRPIPPINSGTVYFSMLVDRSNIGTRYLSMDFLNRGTVLAGFGCNTGSITWSTAILGAGQLTSDISTISPIPTLLVLRVDFGAKTERVRLYVNPIPGQGEPATPKADTAALADFNWTEVNQIRLGAGFDNGTYTTATGTFDEVNIGTSWEDVVKTGFSVWQQTNFAVQDAKSAAAADGDNDGLPNSLEYALGLSPKISDKKPMSGLTPGLPVSELAADRKSLSFRYVFPKDRTDVSYQVQISDDLQNWRPIGDQVDAEDDKMQRRVATVPLATGEFSWRYARLTTNFYSPDRDMGLETPVINTSPGPEYSDAQRSYAMAMSIERTTKGRLWAVWTSGGDSEASYLLVESSDDQGATWSTPRFVIDPSDAPNGLQRRSMVANLWTDPLGRLWLFFDQSMGYFDGRDGVWAIRCDNPDAPTPSWTAPLRIANGAVLTKPTVLKDGTWLLPVSIWQRTAIFATIEKNIYVTPPSAVPTVFADKYHELDPLRMASVFASKDNGVTWIRQGGVAFSRPDFDEHMLVELKDGRLWMLARTLDGICESYSSNRGVSWSAPKLRIQNINSRFFIRRLASGNLLLVKNGLIKERIASRKNLMAYVSEDEGQTWQGGLLLDERTNVSYPDGFQAPDGSLSIMYDRERTKEREILMATFSEADVKAGSLVSPGSQLKRLVNKATGP